jgi:ATP-dependent Clp protease ATP-binding subunit ClpA
VFRSLRLLQDPLAMMLLEGKLSEGDTIEVDVEDAELNFSKARVAAALS